MNKSIIKGNLGKDAVVFQTKNPEISGIGFSVATNKRKTDGTKETIWHDVMYFMKAESAEKLAKHLSQGTSVYVEGENVYKLEKAGEIEYKNWKLKASYLEILKTKSGAASSESESEVEIEKVQEEVAGSFEIEGY